MEAEGHNPAYLVIEGPGHDSTRLPLKEGITSFGRLPANDVILLGDLVSRHHSRITYFDGRATLQDLGSHNGSWVNGERTSSRVLRDGDSVRVGNYRMTFQQGFMADAFEETTVAAHALGGGADGRYLEEEGATVEGFLGEVDAARRGAGASTRAVHFLYRTSDALARAPDVHAYAGFMLDLAGEHAPFDGAAWLRLVGTRLRVELSQGEGRGGLEVFVPAVEWALDKGLPIRSDDVRSDPRFGPADQETPAGPKEAVIVVPIQGEENEGALYLRRRLHPFEAAEMNLVGVVAQLMKEGIADVEYRQATLAERMLAGLHDSYVAERLAVEAAGGRTAPEGPVPVVAVVCEVHGLAATADAFAPEQVLNFLSALLGRTIRIAEKEGGLVESMNGHRLLILFGLSRGTQREPEARRAFETALQVRDEVDDLLCESEYAEFGPRRLQSGIAAGKLVSGAISGRRRSFVLLGSAPAAANRLADAAGPGRILSDQACAERAGLGFETRKVGTPGPQSGARSLTIFELLARAHRSP